MLTFFAVLFGLVIGSFLNVCIYRWPRDLSVWRRSRSFCPHCERTIAWYDNIPIVSYALLRAKCRQCGGRISWRYPVVELLTAACFGLGVCSYGLTWEALKFCLFSALLIGLTFADLEELILPDELTYTGIVTGLLLALAVPVPGFLSWFVIPEAWGWRGRSLGEAAFAAVLFSGMFWLMAVAYERLRDREGLGFGDVKLVAMIGAFLGLQGTLFVVMIGSVAGSVLGVIYAKLAHKDLGSYELPFGSFLGLAALGYAAFTGPLGR